MSWAKKDLKKFNALMANAKKLKDNKEFLESIQTYQEAINLIKAKIKMSGDRRKEIINMKVRKTLFIAYPHLQAGFFEGLSMELLFC